MHLIDDPRAWILRFFEREEREGRGMFCHTFPEGCIPPDAPLVDGEMVYGIYKEKYLFTPQSLILRMPKDNLQIAWRDIQSCSTQHGDGNKKSRLSLKDGSTIDIQMDELAKGWSGRISQLFH